jgi:hypothetical protein
VSAIPKDRHRLTVSNEIIHKTVTRFGGYANAPVDAHLDTANMQHLALLSNDDAIHLDKFLVDGNEFVLQRVAEYLLYDSTQSNGALAKALKKHGLSPSMALSDKAHNDRGITKDTYDVMKSSLQGFVALVEPTQAKAATRFSIVGVESVEAIALAKHDQRVLELLGCNVPEEWTLEQESHKLAAQGEVDLLVEDRLQQLRDDQDVPVDMCAELNAFEPFDSNGADDEKLESYTLKNPTRHMNTQIQEYIRFQTTTLQWMREGGAVGQTTAGADASNFMRFAGWRVSISSTRMQCMSELLTLGPTDIQEFCGFLVETRHVGHGTVANYLNSLLNVLMYVESNMENLTLLLGDSDVLDVRPRLGQVMGAARNLRKQAETQAKQEKLYRPRKPDWISWGEAKTTRAVALAKTLAMEKTIPRAKRLTLLEDALVICFHTVMPPDRVGVIRRLTIGETLKKRDDSEHYYIDLASFKHKTAKFYGPSMTPVSELITPVLQQFLQETQSSFEFTEYDEHEEQLRTRRRYLFAMQSDATRGHGSASWTARVKSAFRRNHHDGKAPCPSLLRSSFITELKSSTSDVSILGSAAVAQKHSMLMQGSDVYDLETHIRLTQKAMDFCHTFALAAPDALSAEVMALEGASGETAPIAKRPRVE